MPAQIKLFHGDRRGIPLRFLSESESIGRFFRLFLLFPLFSFGQRFCPVDKGFLRLPPPLLSAARHATEDTLWVPLAIHVIESQPYELSDERIGAQLRALNRDFAAASIQFYLPRYGPNGQPTCGITRTISPLASHDWMVQEDSLKNLTYWPPDSFLNVWIVSWMPMQVIGYARPLGDTVSLPGLVLLAEVVGEGEGVRIPYDKGRTAVHEMGHVFSLLHPFEGGCSGMTPQTCAVEGDEICDTPPQREPHYGCPSPPVNTCHEMPEDRPDPIRNFMGYVDDACMDHFTPLQIQRMRTFLRTLGATLISEENKYARGFYEPLSDTCRVVASLYRSFPSLPYLYLEAGTTGTRGIQRLWLYDAAGRIQIASEGERIPLPEYLPPGLYFLISEKDGAFFSQKLFWLP